MITSVTATRDYLSDFFYDEENPSPGAEEWFVGLSEFIKNLPPHDPTLAEAVEPVRPFLEDDDRIDCLMYPLGAAVDFVESGWGGDFEDYFSGFVAALNEDGPSPRWPDTSIRR